MGRIVGPRNDFHTYFVLSAPKDRRFGAGDAGKRVRERCFAEHFQRTCRQVHALVERPAKCGGSGARSQAATSRACAVTM